ncbi:MAG: dATP/dGTP diphosphohydrolase domain-containing protein [Candidatus Heimdallarchaeaceae archaeon]
MKNIKKIKYSTGSIRENKEGKGRFDLLPPRAIKRVAKQYEKGTKKYKDRNWEKGQPFSRFIDSALRHMFQYLEGLKDEDHITAAAFNILAIIEQEEKIKEKKLPKELNDL